MKTRFFLYLLAFTILYSSNTIYAQQVPLSSQYMFNQLVLNPAVAGSSDRIVTRLDNRNQWIGIDGAPTTQTLSMHGLISSLNLGVGGYIFRDQVGPFSQTGAQLAAAYHIQLTEEAKLSLALQGGAFQYLIDLSKLKAGQQNDNALNGSTITSFVPDATFGAYLYTPHYYVGFAIPHIVAGSAKTGDVQGSDISRHYLLHAGASFAVSDAFKIEPSIVARYIANQLSLDLSTKVFYQNTIWLGTTYRPQDAIVMLLGIKISDKMYIGYSYDITINNLNLYSKGTHEIMLGFDIFPKASAGRRPIESNTSFE